MSHENFENKNVYILNFGKVSTTNQTKRTQRKVMRSVCGPRRAMRGPRRAMRGRCTGCDTRTSTGWLSVRAARCTVRGLFAMRCDARGLVAFARCAVMHGRCAGRCAANWLRCNALCRRAGCIRAVQAAPCF